MPSPDLDPQRLSRRGLLSAGLALGASALPGLSLAASSGGPPLGPPSAFSFNRLKSMAAGLAHRPYAPTPSAPSLAQIDYDAIGQIRFRPEMSLWGDQPGDAGVRFFHLGKYARRPVKIYAVQGGQAREVLYSEKLFDIGDPALAQRLSSQTGFAGFRVMNADHDTDWLAFQGASYFRSADPFNQYGLSARGIALDTAVAGPESFPDFTRFWLERTPDGRLVIYALMEGAEVTGAYRIDNRRSRAGLVQTIDSALFFRASVQRLGIAPLTSMFWYGFGGAPGDADWRPQIHDSDGLAIVTGSGERIWRPLLDPPRVVVNSFMDHGPKGFGLVQRDRVFDHYQDDGVFYEKRPSAWIEPIGDWGAGAVELVELPTDDETNDNVVAFWTPAKPPRAGTHLNFSYRLSWTGTEPSASGIARVIATRTGEGGRPGQPRPPGLRKVVIDFEGDALAGLDRRSGVTPAVSVLRGKVVDAAAYPIVGAKNQWRLMMDVQIQDPDSADLRAILKRGGGALTETWTYQLFAKA